MARNYRPVIRDQEFLLPPNMADWLPEDHLVWFVLDVVEQLDTAGFHTQRKTGGVGRQGYDPDMLLGLLIYSYAVGERSSRRIERLCIDHVAFRVACGQDGPDHSTLARFRAQHHGEFADLFAQVLHLCSSAGMVKVGVISIDGTKIAANASRSKSRSHDWVRQEAARLAAAEVIADAEQTDAAEDAAAARTGSGSDGDLPPGFATRRARAANIKKAVAELDRQDTDHAQAEAADQVRANEILVRAETEPLHGPVPAGVDPVVYHQARIRRIRRVIAEQDGVPGRAAAVIRGNARRSLKETEAQLAKAVAATAAGEVDLRGPSRRARDQRATRARGRGGLADAVNVTDPDSRLMSEGSGGGSVQGFNAQVAVTDDHIILGVHVSQDANDTHCYAPTLDAATAQATALGKTIDLVLADAGYFTDTNLTTHGPDRLIAPGKHRDLAREQRDNPTHGPPPPGMDAKQAMQYRLRNRENAAQYKRRSATVEPVIGQVKDKIKLRRFARRGIQAVTAELNLAAAVLNLTKLHQKAQATG